MYILYFISSKRLSICCQNIPNVKFVLLLCEKDKGMIIMPTSLHKHPHYALRIPKETMNKLKYISDYYGRSANKEIEQLIKAHIRNFESEHGEISLEDFTPRSRS